MKKVIDQCYRALEEKEVPVGCVFVHIPSKRIFIESHNLTNKLKNATKHAEINCFDSIENISRDKYLTEAFIREKKLKFSVEKNLNSIFSESALFVSCEPCIMCAYSLSIMSKNILKI
jgi:tRNA-specific adenosine deaminase 2